MPSLSSAELAVLTRQVRFPAQQLTSYFWYGCLGARMYGGLHVGTERDTPSYGEVSLCTYL